MKKILITGGAGFIGSHLVRVFVNKYPDYKVYNLDMNDPQKQICHFLVHN